MIKSVIDYSAQQNSTKHRRQTKLKFAEQSILVYRLIVMMTKAILLASSLLLLPGLATQASLVEAPKPSSSPSKTSAYVDARLKSIRITDFKIEHVVFSKALEHLDGVLEPHELQIIFRAYNAKDPEVSLKTRNLSFADNLSYLCRQAGYDWWVDNGVIIVAQPESNEALVTEIIPINNPTVRRLSY